MFFICISIIILCLINLLNVLRINKLEKLVDFLMNKKMETIIANAEEYLKLFTTKVKQALAIVIVHIVNIIILIV